MNQEISAEDKRQYQRLDKIIGITFIDSQGRERVGMTRDISLSGIAFLTEEAINKDTELLVTILNDHTGEVMQLPSKVIRSTEAGIGFITAGQFQPLAEKIKADLEEFIEKYKN